MSFVIAKCGNCLHRRANDSPCLAAQMFPVAKIYDDVPGIGSCCNWEDAYLVNSSVKEARLSGLEQGFVWITDQEDPALDHLNAGLRVLGMPFRVHRKKVTEE